MKQLYINKFGAQKLRSNQRELYQSDIENPSAGLFPGQWIELIDKKKAKSYLAHIYSLFDDKVFCYVHGDYVSEPQLYIENKLTQALNFRKKFKNYFPHARLVYGASDGLSGLTIDGYANVNLIEINSPAYDAYQDLIKSIVEKNTENPCEIHIKKQTRLDAGIPIIEVEDNNINIEISENDLSLEIFRKAAQKNGYYYDHRENRLRSRRIIDSLIDKPKTAIDLFCYVGSWGLSFLKEGIENVTFVDQADMSENILANLERNGFQEKGSFIRSDVFKFLDQDKQTYDLVCSDPPAFAKSKKSKKRALEGYAKLHAKALAKVNKGGIFIAASCTKYVSLDEFQKTVFDAAKKLNIDLKLLDIGVQGFDHPFDSFDSNSNYIKYVMYSVE